METHKLSKRIRSGSIYFRYTTKMLLMDMREPGDGLSTRKVKVRTLKLSRRNNQFNEVPC